jgi:hypothetical protein
MASQRASPILFQNGKRSKKLTKFRIGSTPLIELLRTFKESECAVILDKVYALLSLSSDYRDYPVDYATSPAQLCLDLYRHVRPTTDMKGYMTTLAGILDVSPQQDQVSMRQKTALAVGYDPTRHIPYAHLHNEPA